MTKDQTTPGGAQVPAPANPHKRRKPLPWCQPKSIEEDPEALQRVHTIMESPSYRRSDQDIDFLARDELRGVRLQLDYFIPLRLLVSIIVDRWQAQPISTLITRRARL